MEIDRQIYVIYNPRVYIIIYINIISYTNINIYKSLSKNNKTSVHNRQQPPVNNMEIALERQALIDLYNSTNGDHWKRNTNWCSNKDISKWYGVEVNSNGHVSRINLRYNNLTGITETEYS